MTTQRKSIGRYGRTLGKLLEQKRKDAGLTLREAAESSKIGTFQFLHKLELEISIPTAAQANKLAKLYDMPEKNLRAEVVKLILARSKRKYGFK